MKAPSAQSSGGLRAALALAVAACTPEGAAHEQPAAPASTAPAASTSPEPSAAESAAPPAPVSRASGPCGGKPIGAHACDGAKVLRCGENDAQTEATCLDIETCDAAAGRCKPACPEHMVYIPATTREGFVMGKNFMEGAEGKNLGKGHMTGTDIPHRVVLTKPFCLDANEVTVRQYKVCMKDHECRTPDIAHRFVMWPDHEEYPINCVSWHDAKHYCKTVGKTLPTEAQWEWAATGGDGRAYPWGNEPANCERADYVPGMLGDQTGEGMKYHPAADAGCGQGGPSPVGTHPKGDKVWPDGALHDMAGNVWEWVLDNYRKYDTKPQTDPLVWLAKDLPHSLRGGGWNRSHQGIKAAFRGAGVHDYRVPGLGFRCALNVDKHDPIPAKDQEP
jgi:formylglycine-generating enzyme required for sulfatase activity